jgi:excisionase family DNA binding protein
MTPPIPLLTLPEVAAALRVCRRTVEKLIRRRKLKARKVGRLTRVKATDLESYLESSRVR